MAFATLLQVCDLDFPLTLARRALGLNRQVSTPSYCRLGNCQFILHFAKTGSGNRLGSGLPSPLRVKGSPNLAEFTWGVSYPSAHCMYRTVHASPPRLPFRHQPIFIFQPQFYSASRKLSKKKQGDLLRLCSGWVTLTSKLSRWGRRGSGQESWDDTGSRDGRRNGWGCADGRWRYKGWGRRRRQG